jgi:Protein of unknown function, DUF547
MKKYLILLVLILSTSILQSQTTTLFFEQSNEFLKDNVTPEGKINYTRLKKSPGELLYILGNISDIELDKNDKDTQIAFWVNAFNLIVIKNVIDNYPLKSVNFVSDFYIKPQKIAKEDISLEDIELKLKSITSDPGINFVLSNGSNSFPKLMNAAYLPETIAYQITFAVKSTINKPNFFKIDKDKNTIELPKMFETNKKEFVTIYYNEIDFLNIFLDKKIDNKLKILKGNYDLSLNDLN